MLRSLGPDFSVGGINSVSLMPWVFKDKVELRHTMSTRMVYGVLKTRNSTNEKLKIFHWLIAS